MPHPARKPTGTLEKEDTLWFNKIMIGQKITRSVSRIYYTSIMTTIMVKNPYNFTIFINFNSVFTSFRICHGNLHFRLTKLSTLTCLEAVP